MKISSQSTAVSACKGGQNASNRWQTMADTPSKATANQSQDGSQAPGANALKRISVSDILGSDRRAILLHAGEEYVLQITSNDKLLLTK